MPQGSNAPHPTAQITPDCPAEAAAKWQQFIEAVSRQRGFNWVKSWLEPLVYDGARLVAPTRFIAGQVNTEVGHDLLDAGFGKVLDPPATPPQASPA